MILDGASRRNLELDINLSGGRENTLQSVVDRCQTAMASRLMSRWLNRPLRDRAVLEARQESIACLLERYRFENLQPQLQEIGDLERILARIGLRNARPRDLARLRDALAALPDLQNAMTELEAPHLRGAGHHHRHLSRTRRTAGQGDHRQPASGDPRRWRDQDRL